MNKTVLLGAFGLLAAFSLIFSLSCGDDDDTSDTQGAEAEFCNDLAAFNAAMIQLRNLTPASTVDEAEEARDNAKSAFDDLKDSARKSIDAQVNALEDSYDELNSAVNDLDGDQTLAGAATSLQDDVAQAQLAEANLRRGANCP